MQQVLNHPSSKANAGTKRLDNPHSLSDHEVSSSFQSREWKVFLPSMRAQADKDFSQPATPFSHTRPFQLATCYNPSLFTAPRNMEDGQDWRLGQAGHNFRDEFQTLAIL